MRALAIVAPLLLGGCQLLLGIEDPAGDECSPFDVTTCDPTDTCDIDLDNGTLTCRIEGTVQANELCFDQDDCAGPLSCVDGVCHTFCPVYGQACSDTGEGECLKQWSSETVCDSPCDVIGNTGCVAGADCFVSFNDLAVPMAWCLQNGSGGIVAGGEPCTFFSECLPGYACYDPDQDSAGTCTPLCIVGEPCATGTCEAVLSDPIHGQMIGLCPP